MPRTPDFRYDVFLSHNSGDKPQVRRLAERLKAAGLRVWFDEWVIRPGDDIYLAVERGLEAARVQVLCLSPAALGSDWVTLERSTVLFRDPVNSGRRFIPLLLADCALPDALRRYKHVDFREDAEAAFEELLKICRVEVPEPLPPTGERHGNAAPCSAAASGMPEPLSEFRARLLAAGGTVPELDEETRQALLRNAPASVEEYRLARVAEWSEPRFDLDKRFTRLTLLPDQGREAQGARWQAQPRPQPFDDLRDVLKETDATALVLLGPPGCGKSTLLRRLELDLALDALRGPGGDAPLSLFLPLSRHRPARARGDPPPPREWLAAEWAQRHPRLPGLRELLRRGPFLLLLDAVNEIPHAGPEDYRGRIGLWRELLADLAREAPGVRAVFTCRSLDYSALLSTPESPVPQVRIEPLKDEQMEQFLGAYDPARGPDLWRELRGTPQLELFRSPFYLRLLLAHRGHDGRLSKGRAALFTGFVRQALRREMEAGHRLFQAGALLDRRDYERMVRGERDGFELPARGPSLCAALSRLAFRLQKRRGAGDGSRVHAGWDDALALLGGGEEAERLLGVRRDICHRRLPLDRPGALVARVVAASLVFGA